RRGCAQGRAAARARAPRARRVAGRSPRAARRTRLNAGHAGGWSGDKRAARAGAAVTDGLMSDGLMSDRARDAASAAIGRAALFRLLVVGAMSIYASIELRPFYADASYYLLRILEREDYMLAAPARRAVEWLRQFPVIAAMRLGIGDLATLGYVFAFSIAL